MAQKTHAAGAAIAMAMPVVAMDAERQRAPSMAMAVPAAATNRPTQSGLTFQFVFMLFPNGRIAAAWTIRHKRPELCFWSGCFFVLTREPREVAPTIIRPNFRDEEHYQ